MKWIYLNPPPAATRLVRSRLGFDYFSLLPWLDPPGFPFVDVFEPDFPLLPLPFPLSGIAFLLRTKLRLIAQSHLLQFTRQLGRPFTRHSRASCTRTEKQANGASDDETQDQGSPCEAAGPGSASCRVCGAGSGIGRVPVYGTAAGLSIPACGCSGLGLRIC